MPYSKRSEVSIYFEDQGSGPCLLMAHSFLCSGVMWAAQAEALSDSYRVVNVDLRGHGRSSPANGGLSLSDLANDHIGVLDDLGIEQATWVGLSIGGMISLRAVIDHPERVNALVIADSSGAAEPAAGRVRYRAMEMGSKLLGMYDELTSRVIGQEEAIRKLTKAIQRTRVGLKDPKKPIGSFVFLGPTGVGKTEMAKVLATYLFDKEDALVRIDMSEYMEKFSVSRLVGAPPGYVGYEEGGQLTEKVRRKPYSVILLDEIEKAHPDIYNILLQVLDDGILTDGLGRRVDFRNTILIMTSNIGARDLKDFGAGVGFATQSRSDNMDDLMKSTIQSALKKTFSPEFLNRLDNVIIFNSLPRERIHEIIDLSLEKLFVRIRNLGYKIELTEKAKDFLTEKGYDPQYGVRPLNRAIQKYLEDAVAEEILKGELTEGDIILADHDGKSEELKIKVKRKKQEVGKKEGK